MIPKMEWGKYLFPWAGVETPSENAIEVLPSYLGDIFHYSEDSGNSSDHEGHGARFFGNTSDKGSSYCIHKIY